MLRVLELCAGVSGSYAVIRDMGYRVATWHAVESDGKTRMVVDYMYDGAMKHVGDDVGEINVTQEYGAERIQRHWVLTMKEQTCSYSVQG